MARKRTATPARNSGYIKHLLASAERDLATARPTSPMHGYAAKQVAQLRAELATAPVGDFTPSYTDQFGTVARGAVVVR